MHESEIESKIVDLGGVCNRILDRIRELERSIEKLESEVEQLKEAEGNGSGFMPGEI